ncbi:MAG: type II toxin-antitoxin system YafQ family toxin [Opitutales bacterium]
MSPSAPSDGWQFKATHRFWKSYEKLPKQQRESARKVWKTFQTDPFSPSLKTHKIQALSAKARKTVYSVRIEGDLRAVFIVEGPAIVTLDIGTHAIYR